MNAKELAELGDHLFGKRSALDSLWQECAENFYPERADFTVKRWLGEDFAANLMTSWPVICRRDLGNQIGMMLRPRQRPWFHVKRKFEEKDEPDTELRQWLEWFEQTQRRAMYDPDALFTRATKQADDDFSGFGQAVLSVELNKEADGLLFRTWHLRDVAWQEDDEGKIGFVVRRWKPTLQTLARTFKNVHPEYARKMAKDPFCEARVLHIVCKADMYDEASNGRPRWSIWWDQEHQQLLEATPIMGRHYVIPRWQVIGSQYAYSPAVVAALPDARLIQAMTFTLLEVGEKASNPPMIATQDVVRSDVAVFAGGITWVDKEYDERLGEALRPIAQDFRGVGFGMQMKAETQAMIKEAFFLNKLQPFNPANPEMTAFQAGQLVQEYIRNAMPIFEPMEQEYNAALCEETFGLLQRHGAFGSPLDWPRRLRGIEIDFRFESPLHDVIEQQKGQKWLEAKALLADAITLDPSTRFLLDARTALRDALAGVQVPAQWLNTEDEVERMIEQEQQAAQTQQLLQTMQQGASVASELAGAQKTMAEAGGTI